MKESRRPRVLDIALEAGVSTATVDRVVNERGGVSARTVALVREAEVRLSDHAPSGLGQPHPSAQSRDRHYDIVLPADAGLSTDYLAAAIRYQAERYGITLRIRQIDRMNPAALAAELLEVGRSGSAGVAFQALDHPLVLEAVAALRDSAIPVATVVSGLSSSLNLLHVGLDNRGAGRTAAFLMGSFIAGAGRVAVIWSGSLSRAHEERESGFRTLLRDEFPGIEVVDVDIGRHEPVETQDMLRKVLGDSGAFAGAYCVGAGLASLIDAVSVHPRANRPTIIGHNLTERTREYLMDRSVSVVIHQDMMQIAEAVIAGFAGAKRIDTVTVPTAIITRENLDQYFNLANLKQFASGSQP